MSRLENCVVISSSETEYVTIAQVGKEMICMIDYLKELGKKKSEKILYIDSQNAIQFMENLIYHSKIKHVKRRYHFTLEVGDMCLEKIEFKESRKLRLCKALVVLCNEDIDGEENHLRMKFLVD